MRVPALAARGECVQHLHGSVPARGALRLHGDAGCRQSRRLRAGGAAGERRGRGACGRARELSRPALLRGHREPAHGQPHHPAQQPGRNGDEQLRMIARVNEMNRRRDPGEAITVSVEIEKPEKLDTHQLIGHGDVVFISKDFAKHAGYNSAEAAVRGLYGRVKRGGVLVCAWGEQGAAATGPSGEVACSPAFPPPTLVDTLGAGDTFIAGVIAALSRGQSLQEALTFGCRVAGKKCGVQGYEGLGELC
ncbi:ketohexokinase isoform X8 [Petromyzon marinus]